MFATIVILTKNGEATIGRCLTAIQQQAGCDQPEILVVDSGSTDRTVEIALRLGVRVHSIPPTQFNYGLTKNLAAELARGDVIVYLSQDNLPADANWLSSLLRPLESPDVAAVQGLWKSGPDGHFWWRDGGFWFTREIREWNKEFGFGLSSTNLAVRRSALSRVPFREVPMGEDKALQRDLRDTGLRIAIAGDSVIVHTHRYSLGALCRRIENEGLAARASGSWYGLLDMVCDWFQVRTWERWIEALRRGQLKTASEIFFPWIRPVMVYKGFRWSRGYFWEKESSLGPNRNSREGRS